MDRRMDGRTDKTGCRVACTRLKTKNKQHHYFDVATNQTFFVEKMSDYARSTFFNPEVAQHKKIA